MMWHVQYRTGAMEERIAQYSGPEGAIEAACKLIDNGSNVYGIGTGPLTDSVGPPEINKIYAIWAKVIPKRIV
jgi:hypothetical protein